MEKLKRSKVKTFVYVVIIVAVVFCGNWLYKGRRVHFEDDMMRQVICLELGKDKDSQDVTYRDLDSIEELKIGPVGNFETIEDVAKCKNLKKLWVNVEITENVAYYEVFEKKENGTIYYPPVSEEKLKRIQKDLEKILKNAKLIEDFGFTNVNKSLNIENIGFLKYGKNLKVLNISYANIEDYSVLKNCRKLEEIELWKDNIEKADVLLKLENIKKIWITGTPLAQNQEEIAKLKIAFPEAEIIVD